MTAARGRPQQLATDKGRFYTDPADPTRKYPSVTNVLSLAIAKPALIGWAAKETAQAAVDRAATLAADVEADRDKVLRELKGSRFASNEAAITLGNRVHDLAERHALGQDWTDLLTADEDPRVAATMHHFGRFLEDWRPVYEAVEAVVVNRTVGYAGTCDALLTLPGGDLAVLDYKTGKSGPYDEWSLQLAAYARAEALWVGQGDTATEVPMPAVGRRAYVLRLRPDGYWLHGVDLTDDVWLTFRAARLVAQFQVQGGDRFGRALDAPTTAKAA